jgi:hypothetical protein
MKSKTLQKYLDNNKGKFHYSFDFITKSPALKGHTSKKIILNIMVGSDYAMNDKVIWTREKYQELSGCSYSAVRDIFDSLTYEHILIQIKDTTNYDLDFGSLMRRLENKQPLSIPRRIKKTGLQDKTSGLQDKSTGLEDKTTGLQDKNTGLQDQHIDTIHIIDNNKSIISEDDGDFRSPPSKPNKTITKRELEHFLNSIDI